LSKKWIEQRERSNSITLKLICWIALNTSRGIARCLLYPITFYFFITSPRVRTASGNYLRRVSNKRAGCWDIAKHIYWFSATILDRVYFLTDQDDKFHITIHGKELLDEKVKQGKGCILLGSHVGSLAISKMGLPVKILMRLEHNQMITKILEELNPKVARSVINLTDPNALFKTKECLDEGALVGILGDRVSENEKSIAVEFMGDSAFFPVAPMKLASVLGVPVIIFFGLYRGKNRYEIYFETLTDKIDVPRKDRDTEIERLIRRYVERLDYYLKLAPLNWFNFYDFWEDEEKKL